jgi:hypothetical protein
VACGIVHSITLNREQCAIEQTKPIVRSKHRSEQTQSVNTLNKRQSGEIYRAHRAPRHRVGANSHWQPVRMNGMRKKKMFAKSKIIRVNKKQLLVENINNNNNFSV